MASPDGHGSVLSEWAASHLDRMVRPALASLVSRRHGGTGARTRTGSHLDVFLAAPLPYRAFLDCHSVANQHYFDEQLCIPELSGADNGCPVAGRYIFVALFDASVARGRNGE